MQAQPVVLIFRGNVLEKILVCRDGERWRTVAPFDLKAAAGFNFGKIDDLPRVGDDMSVSDDAADATTCEKNEDGQDCDAELFHGSVVHK